MGPDNVAHFRPFPPEVLKANTVPSPRSLLFIAPLGSAAELERQLEHEANEAEE